MRRRPAAPVQPFRPGTHPSATYPFPEIAMRHVLLFAAVLLAPLPALASQECKYQAPRQLHDDLKGVRGVQISVNAQDLHLSGSTTATGLALDGRACASDQSVLDSLTVESRRDGDQLSIELARRSGMHINLFGSSYSSLDVNVHLPASMPVTVSVGSGDADVADLQQLDSQVGSGDLHVRRIAGRFATSVGSGDVDASDVGSLSIGSVGSGDARIDGIRGDARVGSVGSGDVTLKHVGGSVHADTIGSGDLGVHDVGGDFSLGAKGSGDVDYSGVKGKVSVPRDDD